MSKGFVGSDFPEWGRSRGCGRCGRVLARDKPASDSGAVVGYILAARVRLFLSPNALRLLLPIPLQFLLPCLLVVAGFGSRV